MPFDSRTGIATDFSQLVGNTPMLYLKNMNTTPAIIALKLESENPMASVKDRLALGIIEKSEKAGLFIPGKSVLVEATSGNTGIALAHQGKLRGYQVILTMPETMSIERRTLLKILGADVILTPAQYGLKGSLEKAKEIVANTPNAVMAQQFNSPFNAEIHFETTGPELWRQTEGRIDIFVAGVGTGGTITGVARFLKSQGSNCRIVAVEPAESPVLSGGKPGPHKIQGIGAGFVPAAMDPSLIDEIFPVSSEDAISTARDLAKKDSVFCGFSGGAAVFAALQLGARPENVGKVIVPLIPSFGERYLSTALFQAVRDEAANLPVSPVNMPS
jgi:cysteine synthase A